jgi:rod shape-determining protein MreC
MKSYLLLGVTLFLLLNANRENVDAIRGRLISWISPLWQAVAFAKESPHPQNEVELILLRAQLEEMRVYLAQKHWRNISATPATVLFRDPNNWSRNIWISLGEQDNRDQMCIAKNSPVLLGGSLIGVVEYVGQTQSRVRLITDAGLTVAVRAVRGEAQNRELLTHLDLLIEQLHTRPDLFSSQEEQRRFLAFLTPLQQRLLPCKEEQLAKGELHGSSAPLWKSSSPTLKGIGFNYDMPDAAGPARDLHTPGLLKIGDLLVTSGLDGVFPAGIPTAIVTNIEPLKTGEHFYTVETKPTAGNLQDLNFVFVLPPLDSKTREAPLPCTSSR